MSRWVRIQADVFEHGAFAADPYSEREAWLWLIARAAWKDTKHRIGKTVVDVPAGSIFITLREMQSVWRWKSDKKVRSFLAMLENERMIETKTDAGKTQVSICNYSRYQEAGRTENASGTHGGRTADALKTPIHHSTSSEDANASSSPEPAKAAPAFSLPCTSGEVFEVFEPDIIEWRQSFPAVDVLQQLAAMRSWLNANPSKRKTKRGARRFVVSWLDKRQNAGGAPPPRQHAPPGRMDHGRMWANEANGMGAGHDEPPDEPTRYDLAGEASGHDRRARTIELSALPTSRTGH